MVEDEGLDAIAIATSPTEQPAIAIAAMNNGKHVFCEKPVADSLATASSMLESANRSGVANMVDFMFPEIDIWQRAKAIIESEGIGIVHRAIVDWSVETYVVRHRLKSWKVDPSSGGGALNNFGSHTFHYLEWLFGPIRTLSCRVTPNAAGDPHRETAAAIEVCFASGATAVVAVRIDAVPSTAHRVQVFSRGGQLRLENSTADHVRGFELAWETEKGGTVVEVPPIVPSGGGDSRVTPVSKLVSRFCDWIEVGRPAVPTLWHGTRVQALLEASRRSAAGGHTIEV